MWTIVIVILVISMMLGPIMIMQPSKRQRRLAKLRSHAQKLGLSVGSSTLQTANGRICWFYWLSLPKQCQLPLASLQRESYAHGLHLADFWATKQPIPDPHRIEGFLKALPDTVYGVDINDNTLGIHWSEKEGIAGLEVLHGLLKSLSETVPSKPSIETDNTD